SYAGPWKQSLTHYPLEFGLVLIAIAISLSGSQILEGRIHDRARLIWHRANEENLRKLEDYRAWRNESRKSFARSVRNWVVGLIVAAIVAYLVSGTVMAAGFLATALVVAVAYGISVIGHRVEADTPVTHVRNTLALRIARGLRENVALGWLYNRLNFAVL